MGTSSLRAVLAASLAIVAIAALPATAGAQSIPPGQDALTTHADESSFQFPFPEDFFPGCPAFFADIPLTGVRFVDDGGIDDLGNADTIVQRLGPIPPNPQGAEVPIQIVELQLQSIAPISIECEGGFQNWMTEVSLSDSNQPGQMQVTQNQPNGGFFDAFFPVIPVLTFTRVDGPGDPVVIDVGQGPQQLQDQFFFQLQQVPWRLGPCPFPGYSGPGVNDQWCPMPPAGQPTLVPLTARSDVVTHEVFPAQPALEHFKCYQQKRLTGKAKRKAAFKPVNVSLVDQFGGGDYKVKKRAELCTPSQKRGEPWLNRAAHQQCYAITGDPLNLVAQTSNQFGIQGLIVGKPRRLCLPTEKKELPGGKANPIGVPIEHFTCYDVKPQTPLYSTTGGKPNKVPTKDQFGRERVKLGDPKLLCAPTEKNSEGFNLPLEHQLCYKVKGRDAREKVEIKNQFERKKIKLKKPKLFCLPTYKHVARGVAF